MSSKKNSPRQVSINITTGNRWTVFHYELPWDHREKYDLIMIPLPKPLAIEVFHELYPREYVYEDHYPASYGRTWDISEYTSTRLIYKKYSTSLNQKEVIWISHKEAAGVLQRLVRGW